MTVVGVDVSSRRIDTAWLDKDGRPQRWHIDLGKGHLIDRLRRIDMRWPDHGFDLSDIAVEYPFGRGNAIAALMATVGVITRQAPPWSRVAWPSSGELRAAINAKNTKLDAHLQLWSIFANDTPQHPHGTVQHFMNNELNPLGNWDEHELDALVACLGWTRILAAQDAA